MSFRPDCDVPSKEMPRNNAPHPSATTKQMFSVKANRHWSNVKTLWKSTPKRQNSERIPQGAQHRDSTLKNMWRHTSWHGKQQVTKMAKLDLSAAFEIIDHAIIMNRRYPR